MALASAIGALIVSVSVSGTNVLMQRNFATRGEENACVARLGAEYDVRYGRASLAAVSPGSRLPDGSLSPDVLARIAELEQTLNKLDDIEARCFTPRDENGHPVSTPGSTPP